MSKAGCLVLSVLAILSFARVHAQVQHFNVGDAVDMNLSGTWKSCVVASPFKGGGYDLKCDGQTGYRAAADKAHLRPHQAEGAAGQTNGGAAQKFPTQQGGTQKAGAQQTKPGNGGAGNAAGQFKVGDTVEIKSAGKWIPCTVAKPMYGGGYDVHCGPLDLRAAADAEHIRARAATAAEQNTQNETNAAMAHRPTGNGIGAQYGTREPATCKNRGGPLTNATARQYLICDEEGEKAGSMYLVTDVSVQLGIARAFNWNQDSASTGIDTSQQVYDIRGSYNLYQCTKPTPIDNDFSRTHNCMLFDEPQSEGRCYKNTFGEWHCLMTDSHRSAWPKAKNVMPPGGN